MKIYSDNEEKNPNKITPLIACCINGHVSYGGFMGQEDTNKIAPIGLYSPNEEESKSSEYYTSDKIFRYICNNHLRNKLSELTKIYNTSAEKYKKTQSSFEKAELEKAAFFFENHLEEMRNFFSKKDWLDLLVNKEHINHLIGYKIRGSRIKSSMYDISGVIAKDADFTFGEIVGFDIVDNPADTENVKHISDVHENAKTIVLNNKQKDLIAEYVVFGETYGLCSSPYWVMVESKVFAKDETIAEELCSGNFSDLVAHKKEIYDDKLNSSIEKYLNKGVQIIKEDDFYKDSRSHADLKIDEVSLDKDLNPLFHVSGEGVSYSEKFTPDNIKLMKEK